MQRPLTILLGTLTVALLASGIGCNGMLLVGGPGADAIAFVEGELLTREEAPLADVDAATGDAIEAVGGELVNVERDTETSHWQARTVGGDPIEIHLTSKGRKRTQLRIRVGVLGDEARSRLVLQEIHQSLAEPENRNQADVEQRS